MEMNCNVIRDLLPLYAEELVSEDSRKIIDTHLRDCPGCRDALAAMRAPVEIPKDNGATLWVTIEHIMWDGTISVMALIMAGLMLTGLIFGIMMHPVPVSMQEVLVSVTEQDGMIVEEFTAYGAGNIRIRTQRAPENPGKNIRILSAGRSLCDVLLGSVPVTEETYSWDHPTDQYQSIWYYEEGKLIHLWGDETVPDIETMERSPWLWYAVGLGLLTGSLAWWKKSKKLGMVSLFFFLAAASDLIITGGNWFHFTGSPGDGLAVRICIVLLACMLTFGIFVCGYLLRNIRRDGVKKLLLWGTGLILVLAVIALGIYWLSIYPVPIPLG